ncbi:MAG: hypothetical protein AAF682_31155 [Planctomycetota bacterium]
MQLDPEPDSSFNRPDASPGDGGNLARPEDPGQAEQPDAAERTAQRATSEGLLPFTLAEAYRRAVERTMVSVARREASWTATDAARALGSFPGTSEDDVLRVLTGEESELRAAFRRGGGDDQAVRSPSTAGSGLLFEIAGVTVPITWEVTRRSSADTGTLRAPEFSDRLSIENAARRRATAKKFLRRLRIAECEDHLDALDSLMLALGRIDADARSEIESKSSESDTDLLLALVEGLEVELFHTPGGLDADCYATVPVKDHHEVWPLESRGFRRWAAHEFRNAYGRAPSDIGLQGAQTSLAGEAAFDGDEREVFVRRAFVDGCLYLDLANRKGEAIQIDTEGFRVVDAVDHDVRFLQKNGTLPLPYPAPDGAVDELRKVLNVAKEEDWTLAKGFLLSCLHPTGPYIGIAPNGEQGSGKSWFSRTVRRVIDPSDRDLRRPITNEADLAIAASSSLILAVDNLSRLSENLSDAYCSLATGASLSKRKLYTDFDECSVFFKRPVILNGINNVATRADLADRVLPLNLTPPIKRLSERRLEAAFAEMHPRVLGALLKAASAGLRRWDEIDIDDPERMVDVLHWVTAAEEELGIEPGGFRRVYSAKASSAAREALEDAPVASEVVEFMRSRREAGQFEWCGTCKELDSALRQRWGPDDKPPKGWPRSPQGFGRALRRAAPLLRPEGIAVVEPGENDRPRNYILRIREEPTPDLGARGQSDAVEAQSADDSTSNSDDSLWGATSGWNHAHEPQGLVPDVPVVSDVSRGAPDSSVAERPAESSAPLCGAPDDPPAAGNGHVLGSALPTDAPKAPQTPDPNRGSQCSPRNVGNVGNDEIAPLGAWMADPAQSFVGGQSSESSGPVVEGDRSAVREATREDTHSARRPEAPPESRRGAVDPLAELVADAFNGELIPAGSALDRSLANAVPLEPLPEVRDASRSPASKKRGRPADVPERGGESA